MMVVNTRGFNSVQLPTGAIELDSATGRGITREARVPSQGSGTDTPGRVACDPVRHGAYFRTDELEANDVVYTEGSAETRETLMNEETFNLSIRKFLKMVGVSSQREIEQAVARAIAANAINGDEHFPATVRLEVAGLALDVRFDGEIRLE